MLVLCYGQRLYKYRIRTVLICRSLSDRVVDGELVRLAYEIDQGPHVNGKSWTIPKIKMEALGIL